ncbi:hypothetical protein I8752_26570 [Nostocaceae cyanobacterium CENA369]|uniref:Uncharacterized protein n=1 Tax=Dendronalium phyllosphericum CENA369 TaxID=1725256 RepID=A0A8J7LLA6_9NOST|nr:hypothetical protein [Dendronalium phyllosphericum]MBH8576489.1 hypothetical protein [Dendronalium phyllosphericum CENA369]
MPLGVSNCQYTIGVFDIPNLGLQAIVILGYPKLSSPPKLGRADLLAIAQSVLHLFRTHPA